MPPTALGLNITHGAEDWASFVLAHLATESVLLRAGARFIPVTGRVAHVPRILTDGEASWTAEGVEIDSSAPTGDDLVLTPKKVANVVSLSRESISDAPVSELDALGSALTRSIATALDTKAFSDDVATATAPAGFVDATQIAQATGPVSIDNIIRAVGAVEEVGAVATAAFLSPTDLTALRLVKDLTTGSNRPVLQPNLQEGGAETLSGARLFSVPALPAGTCVVGDASQIIVAVRRDVEVAFSPHAQFTADSVVARVTARVDFGINDGRGLVRISGT